MRRIILVVVIILLLVFGAIYSALRACDQPFVPAGTACYFLLTGRL